MTDISSTDVTLRTTSDNAGLPHGLVAGTGPSPDAAMVTLKRNARDLAARLNRGSAGLGDPFPAWLVEVVDVRLTYGRVDGEDAWCAYGTLSTEGQSPVVGEADFWSATP
jgi:hypothetical protein